jgi:2-succinyl-6-hydroxy-2,4-cyclohexadiene-1-carboxylate synthase
MQYPIFFLHGLFGDASDFEVIKTAFPLSKSCQLSDFSFQDFESLAKEIYHSLEKHLPCHLVGYSLGGRISLYLKDLFPHAFKKVILIGAHFGLDEAEKLDRKAVEAYWQELMDNEPLESFFTLWYKQPLFSSLCKSPSFQRVLKRRYQGPLLFYKKCLHELALSNQKNFSSHFENMREDFLLIYGEWDEKFKKYYEKFQQQGYKLTQILKASHAVHLENPKALIKQIQEFTQS